MSKVVIRIAIASLPRLLVIIAANMAARCSLSTLFPIQNQLDYALEEATTQQKKEELVYRYLKRLDEREDLKIPDFRTG